MEDHTYYLAQEKAIERDLRENKNMKQNKIRTGGGREQGWTWVWPFSGGNC